MAQKQFTTYQADILSFELREAILGALRAGRYSGYDQIASDGSPDGTIYLTLSHSSSAVAKLPMDGSSLGSPIGVAITTQGTIIHEDDSLIDIDIPDNSGGGSYRWYIIYMEHDYDSAVPGANPATYGYIAGTAGAGIPTLTEAYHRVPLGYIRADASATSISGLTYFPAASGQSIGDDRLSEILWGTGDGASLFLDKENDLGADVGYVQNDGVIGDRNYSAQHYVTNWDSITNSINDLDAQANTEEVARTAIGNRAIDAPTWGALTDITDQNVSSSNHGLCPKLSDDATDFLNGVGGWTKPSGRYIKWRSAIPAGNDFDYVIGTGGTQNFDLSSIVTDSDADLVIIEVLGYNIGGGSTQSHWYFFAQGASAGTGSSFMIRPDDDGTTNNSWHFRNEITVRMDSSQRISVVMSSGTLTNVQAIGFRVKGWQTANV